MLYGRAYFVRLGTLLCLFSPLLTGCAAFHPMKGVPVRYLDDDLKVGHRNGQRTIDPSLLSQDWNGVHLVDSGDVLGIYIGGVLGKIEENPQVQIPQNSEYQPAAGVPVTVREDGTISLPLVGSLFVRGRTIAETELLIRRAYTNHEAGKEFLKPDRERILVSLQRPRQVRVLVLRQDSRTEPMASAATGLINIGAAKRGTGKVVSLPIYRNDVLNALAMTDGLPGLDAENAVYVIRRGAFKSANGSLVPHIDPETLIRQSHKTESPVIRGQSPNRFANQRAPGGMGRGISRGQAAINAQEDPADSRGGAPAGSRRQANGDFGTGPQPWSLQNGIEPLGDGMIQTNHDFPAPDDQSLFPGAPGMPQQMMPGFSPQTSAMPVQPLPPGNGSFGPLPGAGAMPVGPGGVFSAPGGPAPGYSLQGPGDLYGSMPNSGVIDPGIGAIGRDSGFLDSSRIVRIPIRMSPEEQLNIRKEDVILHDGDIVFIEARDTEVFFTGGLLGGGQYTLPRDFDLDILQALSIATSRMGSTGAARQIGGVSALNSDVTISPSNVIIIRKLPNGGEIPIKIDLYEARNDLSERIVIQPGDYIYLQYTPAEAVAAFVDRHLLEGALFGLFAQQANRPTN